MLKQQLQSANLPPSLEVKNAELENDPAFWDAISKEAESRFEAMLDGVSTFQSHFHSHEYNSHSVIWRKGNAKLRLFDKGLGKESPLLFCIPSLINKATVFDLLRGYSFVEYMQANGIRVALLDWGEPGFREQHFDCADYVAKFAKDALRAAQKESEGALLALGYCLGGVLATGLAQMEAERMDGLILLATPWDFHSADTLRIQLDAEQRADLRERLYAQDTVPKEWMEWVFHLMQPMRFQEKFSRLHELDKESQQHFFAIEHWLNDGVALSPKVAEECLLSWPQDNRLHNNGWKIKNETIDPSKITLPSLSIIPKQDTVVPQKCAEALSSKLSDAHTIRPACGHVSLMAGKRAAHLCWRPIVSWVSEFAA